MNENILGLYANLTYEDRFTDEMFRKKVYDIALPHLTIVDIGAFEGEFGFYCYNFVKKIYAIEPDSVPYDKMYQKIKKFKLKKIKPFNIAISDNGGLMSYASNHNGDGRLLPEEDSEWKVNTMSLYSFMEKNKIKHIDILKVDTEGGEKLIFNSDTFPLVADKIDAIVGEHLESVSVRLIKCGFTMVSPSLYYIRK